MPNQAKPEVLLVSKPLVAPWDDSGKNIARAQIEHASRYRYRALVPKDAAVDWPPGACEAVPLYETAGGYGAGLRQNLRVFAYGTRPRGAALYHFFFAPNPLTSQAGKLLRSLARVPCVQTICSSPKYPESLRSLLFADRIIALSEHARRQCLCAGVASRRVHLVRPGIDPIERPDEARRIELRRSLGLDDQARIVLYPGDLEFSSASHTVAAAAPAIAKQHPDAVIVFACRAKTPAAAKVRAELEQRLVEQGLGRQILFLGRVPDMPLLAGASEALLLPAETLYAKMDAPLVVLEAMSQAVPVVLADVGPLAEILETGCGIGVAPADPARLASTVSTILSTPSLATSLGHRGQAAIRHEFSAANMASRIEAIYDEVLP